MHQRLLEGVSTTFVVKFGILEANTDIEVSATTCVDVIARGATVFCATFHLHIVVSEEPASKFG